MSMRLRRFRGIAMLAPLMTRMKRMKTCHTILRSLAHTTTTRMQMMNSTNRHLHNVPL
jgi:hypothetical protein